MDHRNIPDSLPIFLMVAMLYKDINQFLSMYELTKLT